MTQVEFIDGVNTWMELLEFCGEYGCDYCDDIYHKTDLTQLIRDDFEEHGHQYAWTQIRDFLDNIVEGYDYYRKDGEFEYVFMDHAGDFEEYKDDVLEWAEDRGVFDEDDIEVDIGDDWIFDEDEPESPFVDEEPSDDEVPDEDFSVTDLFGICNGVLQEIQSASSTNK